MNLTEKERKYMVGKEKPTDKDNHIYCHISATLIGRDVLDYEIVLKELRKLNK